MILNCQTLILKKKEKAEELKNAKHNDLEDLVYRPQLTNDEIIDMLDSKYIPTKIISYSLPPGIYEVVDLTSKDILPDNVKVSVTIDDVGLKSILKVNQTLISTKKSF